MKEFKEFMPYLNKCGIVSDALIRRVEYLYGMFLEICPDEIEDIFVTDYFTESQTREYESLWFFSSAYCMEAKQFVTQNKLDITPIKKRIIYFQIEVHDYDFKGATQASRANLNVLFGAALQANFKSASQNCDSLMNIVKKYIKPNLQM